MVLNPPEVAVAVPLLESKAEIREADPGKNRVVHPFLRDDPPPPPNTSVQEEFAEFRHARWSDPYVAMTDRQDHFLCIWIDGVRTQPQQEPR